MHINHFTTIQLSFNWVMQQFTQLQICNNSHNYKYATIKIQHDKRIHSLIPENKVSNKSKNPAPDFEERIAFLWFGRLERSRKVLLDRIYTYFTSMPGLIRFHYQNLNFKAMFYPF